MGKPEAKKYLEIMIDSLVKKEQLLGHLLVKTREQSKCIDGKSYDDANWSQFEVLIIEKDTIISRIEDLDEGFDKVFERVKLELDNCKEEYSTEIRALQKKIMEITDIGVNISAVEERNRQNIERIVSMSKAGIGKARKSIKATNGYVASMYGNALKIDFSKIDSKK